MDITVNGEKMATEAATVATLLGELRIEGARVAVELNLSVVPKASYGETALKAGDRIEIVNFVGGGA